MQLNANGDMQPCDYLSQMFFSAKHNYDIFDCELPAIIHGLEEWRQYLLRSPFSIEVLTDHKNLIYFKEPWKRPQRQAQWLLFLQDFNMVYHALSGTQMAYTDALSCRDAVDTTQGNIDIQLLPPDTFDQQLWALDVALVDKIKDSSSSDPLVLQAVHQMEKELPLFNRSKAEDWTFDDGRLLQNLSSCPRTSLPRPGCRCPQFVQGQPQWTPPHHRFPFEGLLVVQPLHLCPEICFQVCSLPSAQGPHSSYGPGHYFPCL